MWMLVVSGWCLALWRPWCARPLILGAIGLVLLAAPAVGAAAPIALGSSEPVPPSISVLNVDIWPEHDDPRVLIIYRGQLSAAAPLPYTLAFAIPPSGQVNAAAYRSSDGSLLSAEYQYRQEGDRLQVSFTVPERAFQFEYYADLITRRPGRTMRVEVVLPLQVDTMRVSVEQPLRASAFSLIPAADGTNTATTGFTYHTYTVTRWPVGRAWSVRATYQKADETPSIPRAVQGPAGTRAARPAAGISAWAWAAIGLAALGVVSLAAFWLVRRGERVGRPSATPAGARRAAKTSRKSEASSPVYCTNCGHRARPGDRFCSRCGRALPRESPQD